MATPRNPSTLQSRFGFQDPDLTTPEHDSIVLWLVSHAGEAVELLRVRAFDLLPQHRKNMLALQADLEKTRKAKQAYIEEQKRSAATRLSYQRADGPSSWLQGQIKKAEEEMAALESKLADLAECFRRLPANRLAATTEQIWLQRSEHPILSPSRYTIGFVDLYVATVRERLWLPCYQDEDPEDYELPQPRAGQDRLEYYFEVKPQIRSFGELMRQLRLYESYVSREALLAVVSPDTRFATAIRKEGFSFLAITPDASSEWRFTT